MTVSIEICHHHHQHHHHQHLHYHLHHVASCLKQTLTEMALHPSFSLEVFMYSLLLISVAQMFRLSTYVTRCRPLYLLPWIFPIILSCSVPPFFVDMTHESHALFLLLLFVTFPYLPFPAHLDLIFQNPPAWTKFQLSRHFLMLLVIVYRLPPVAFSCCWWLSIGCLQSLSHAVGDCLSAVSSRFLMLLVIVYRLPPVAFSCCGDCLSAASSRFLMLLVIVYRLPPIAFSCCWWLSIGCLQSLSHAVGDCLSAASKSLSHAVGDCLSAASSRFLMLLVIVYRLPPVAFSCCWWLSIGCLQSLSHAVGDCLSAASSRFLMLLVIVYGCLQSLSLMLLVIVYRLSPVAFSCCWWLSIGCLQSLSHAVGDCLSAVSRQSPTAWEKATGGSHRQSPTAWESDWRQPIDNHQQHEKAIGGSR